LIKRVGKAAAAAAMRVLWVTLRKLVAVMCDMTNEERIAELVSVWAEIRRK